MVDIFNSVKGLRPRKNAFNLSHGNSFTTDMGLVVPVLLRDCVPNSDFRITTHALGRMMALVSPVMDNIDLYVHFWKIPYRILDPNFPKFISGELPDEEYAPPFFTLKGIDDYLVEYGYEHKVGQSVLPFACPGSLLDFLQVAPGAGVRLAGGDTQYSMRPIQAYAALIDYEYRVENISMPLSEKLSVEYSNYDFLDLIRDLIDPTLSGDYSNLVAAFLVALAELPGNPAGVEASEYYWQNADFWKYGFFRHAWRKDYFTSAFPWVQRGDPVSVPLATTAPVTVPRGQDFWLDGPKSGSTLFGVLFQGSHELSSPATGGSISLGETAPTTEHNAIAESFINWTSEDTDHNIQYLRSLQGVNGLDLEGTADLSEASSITINELRILNALQVYKERSLRYGGRYKEYLQGFWNQKSLDARLDYPEWLGGGKLLFNISDIAQTSQTDDTPQGNLAGKGTAFGTGFAGFKHTHIYEESMIVGLLFVVPKPAYCQGISRFRTKLNDRFDFYNPSFDHIGEQAIKGYELYADKGDKAAFDLPFGYQVRYAEYRTHPSEVHGDLRDSLSYWKLTRIFSDRPFLNQEFIYIQPASLLRIFATTQTSGHLLIDMWFDIKALQPMSKYGTPMLMA